MARIDLKMSQHLAEGPEDIAVKDQLWRSIQRELLGFAAKYAEGHQAGNARSERQKDVCAAAKSKHYPIGLVSRLGSFVRRGLSDSEDALAMLDEYRIKIGLASA